MPPRFCDLRAPGHACSIKSRKIKFRAREGYIVVASCWIVASVVGAFPYYLAGFADHYIDALFESTSGFTTTGCSVVAGKFLSGGLLLWKAISNWLGGMGILLFVISILPALGINGQIIAKAETPGPVLKKMTVRMSDSAKILYITYISFTILEIILLMLSGKVPLFDAVINTLGSISTGGVMVHPTGIAYYDSVYVEVVIAVFCILSSLNFVLYHYLITGKFAEVFKDIELRAFLIIMAVSIAVCTIALMAATDSSFGTALRDSFFQVVSMSTTSGYTRSPYMTWPSTCQIILVALMFVGGCASSTSGSLKVVRVLVMFKLIWRGWHQEDTSAFSRRGEARKDCHPCSCGIRDISIRSNIYGHIPVFIIRAVVSGSRTGRYADVRSCNAVQYRHCFRRDCITRQFLLIQSCTQALHELPDDNRTSRAFHDNNPFQQKLLGTRQIDIKHCRIKPQCAGK